MHKIPPIVPFSSPTILKNGKIKDLFSFFILAKNAFNRKRKRREICGQENYGIHRKSKGRRDGCYYLHFGRTLRNPSDFFEGKLFIRRGKLGGTIRGDGSANLKVECQKSFVVRASEFLGAKFLEAEFKILWIKTHFNFYWKRKKKKY